MFVKRVEPKISVWIIIFIISFYLISYFLISSNDQNMTNVWRLREISEKENYGTAAGGREKRWRIVRPVIKTTPRMTCPPSSGSPWAIFSTVITETMAEHAMILAESIKVTNKVTDTETDTETDRDIDELFQ